ncbi:MULTISPECIES: polysialyltransferase family glycosyltransferase [unclassified Oceanobacter]|uniref:polysialyltransferase family glycosyltransferase n=1 Tax=unclassified Oceanobacter TaxID=2620260 RepID=UPI0027328E58|nr:MULTISPECIES: polysialyltransferase family glycosyltransferase [unclassified Oceanobacter]MDP2507112.1 polysialyltransferase family glycosyltransferase [Oceanobacter sp. 3_MG-2023]MDP2549064.1 polysialyltransferase family glycosyltransferase [Oceanobacter sp. 4_MG-2023]
MTNTVYFASTILHLYAAAVIAAERTDEQAHLVFIDQPEEREFPLYTLVQDWPQSPFTSVQLFYGRFKGLGNKLKKRKLLFTKLEALINRLRPANLFVGNDRRIEFQYSMHIADSLGCKPVGHYMDEGTFTYMGRKASSGFGDKVLDNLAKKLSYGFWWKNPPTVGGSGWIQYVHAAFPEHIHPLLKNKHIVQLSASGFTAPPLLALSSQLMEQHGFDPRQLQPLDVLFTLPHESLFEKDPAYKQRIMAILQQMIRDGKQVAAKYHPRNSGPDVLHLQAEGVTLLPAGISFEAMLPHLPNQCEIWGDVSSTLLIAKWLRPELVVCSLQQDNQQQQALVHLFKKIDVKMKQA